MAVPALSTNCPHDSEKRREPLASSDSFGPLARNGYWAHAESYQRFVAQGDWLLQGRGRGFESLSAHWWNPLVRIGSHHAGAVDNLVVNGSTQREPNIPLADDIV